MERKAGLREYNISSHEQSGKPRSTEDWEQG